jgi:hypothetical protein
MLGIQMKGQQRVQKRPKAISEKMKEIFRKLKKVDALSTSEFHMQLCP